MTVDFERSLDRDRAPWTLLCWLVLGALIVEAAIGYPDGVQVAILPVRSGQSLPNALAQLPLWYGEPGVPDLLNGAELDSRLAKAQANGVSARSLDEVRAALARAGGMQQFQGEDDLWRAAARLVLEWAPSERELAEGFLLGPPH